MNGRSRQVGSRGPATPAGGAVEVLYALSPQVFGVPEASVEAWSRRASVRVGCGMPLAPAYPITDLPAGRIAFMTRKG